MKFENIIYHYSLEQHEEVLRLNERRHMAPG